MRFPSSVPIFVLENINKFEIFDMTTNSNKKIRVAIIEDNRFIRNGWEMLFDGADEFEVTGSFSNYEDSVINDDI